MIGGRAVYEWSQFVGGLQFKYVDKRFVTALNDLAVPAYTELNTSLGWTLSPRLQVSLSGFNLLHAHHLEFNGVPEVEVGRSVYADVRLRF